LAKIDYEFDPRDIRYPLRGGTFILDPECFWLIREAKYRLEWPDEKKIGNVHKIEEYGTAGKFPYVKKSTSHMSWATPDGTKCEDDSIWKSTVRTPDHMDERQFTLSGFGMKEPGK
jgi:hypothetical protein